jgi:alpha-N-arabinofuranosidase
MGLLEFLEWCEDLKMDPLLAVFAGFTLGSQHPIVGDSLKPYVQDALEEIEYATGDTTTKWGAVRAKNGHPQPFDLKFVEIGNEDYFDRKMKTSDVRFTQFYDAIKAKYPNIQVIASAPVSTRMPDLEDIHHYFSFKKALQLAHQYDNYKRTKPKVFIGEYACREGAPTTNLKGALGDAAFLTGLERNADIVKMSCYAPLFVNVNPGGMQWKSDLIGYDALNSYGSPSYYVQKTFANNLGDELVQSSISNVPMAADTTEQIFYSVTKDNNKKALFVKMVNVSGDTKQIVFDINSINSIAAEGFATIITSIKANDTNSIAAPKNIIPDTLKTLGLAKQFTYNLKPNSVTVLQLNFN